MAEYKENQIRFGWLTYDEMLGAIADGNLNQHDVCFTKDTHQQFLIDSQLNPIAIKSRVRIFATVEDAIDYVNSDPEAYEGEILSIRDGEKFIGYIVNRFDDGTYYVSPICSDGQVDYNDLQNVPVKNLHGTITEPVVLTELENGHYKVSGHFVTPKGTEINSVVGNYIIVERTGLDERLIKRIGSESIFDYTVKSDGTFTVNQYATTEYIKNQDFATNADVDAKLEAFRISTEEYIKEYVSVTCTLLVRHLVEDELSARYSTKEDIENLFNN